MPKRKQLPDGLAPICGESPRVLILGSFPGGESLRQRAYYAQPRNAFWRIVGAVFGFSPELPYAERCQALTDNGVALWDVIAQCDRPGSLDSRIDRSTIVPNRIPELLESHPQIRLVLCNGRTSEQLFAQLIVPELPPLLAESLTVQYVPSTSPANAGTPEAAKRDQWHEALRTIL